MNKVYQVRKEEIKHWSHKDCTVDAKAEELLEELNISGSIESILLNLNLNLSICGGKWTVDVSVWCLSECVDIKWPVYLDGGTGVTPPAIGRGKYLGGDGGGRMDEQTRETQRQWSLRKTETDGEGKMRLVVRTCFRQQRCRRTICWMQRLVQWKVRRKGNPYSTCEETMVFIQETEWEEI